MISKLFRARTKVAPPSAPAVPPGTVVWCVGDIHGRRDLLAPLVEAMATDLRGSQAERKLVIFLGDYIDRGPESREVIGLLSGLPPARGVEWRFLKGNHEQAMLDFLKDPAEGPRWCEYGGDRALRSWGLRVPDLAHKTEAWARVAADLRHRMTGEEVAFLENLELSLSVGDYFFSHAGARPGLSLDRQSPHDLMRIRQPFLDSVEAFECVVVHGHTPAADVHADRRRIGIDTKAYDTGVLTALRLEGRERWLMQAFGPRRSPGARYSADESPQFPDGAVVVRSRQINGESLTSAGQAGSDPDVGA